MKYSIKILVITCLLAFLLVFAFSGCSDKTDATLTVMIPLQKECFQKFFDLFSNNNSDVTFDLSAYRGGSPSAYLLQRFEANDLTDIVITSYPPDPAIQEATLLDLSGHDFVHNFKSSVLSNLAVDGKIYLLEGPSSVRGIAYNKTLFEQYSWQVPTSHEEFIALINQIKQESNIMPLGVQGKYPGAYFTLMSELSYCGFLQTPSGAEWMQSFAKGEVSSSIGFESGISLLQDWMDAGVFQSSQAVLGDSTLYELFVERGCAMSYVMGSQNKLVEMTEASSDEFGMFPIYGLEEGSEFVATTHGIKIGLNKKLGEPGNEKKLEKALKVMEFLSTEEGQMVFHTGRGDILPLTGSSYTLSSLFEELNVVMEKGHCAPFLYPGYEDILAHAGEYIRDVCNKTSKNSLDGVFALMDGLRQDSLNEKANYIATVSETLDELQTAQYVANALHAQGYGDFALVSKGRYSKYFDLAGGANGKMYEGGISSMYVNLPLSNLAAQATVTMSLTGAQVRTLLEQGRILSDDEGHTDSFEYFYAGISVERNSDGTVKTIIFNGEPLEDTELYSVVFSPQDYSDETAALGDPQSTGIAWQDAYLAYIKKIGCITPEHAKLD